MSGPDLNDALRADPEGARRHVEEMLGRQVDFPLGVEGSVRNPSTPGEWNDPETDPTAVYP